MSVDYNNEWNVLHDSQMEASVLGSVLINPDTYYEISPLLDKGMFYDIRNNMVWEAFVNLIAQKKAIDVLTVMSELDVCGHSSEVKQAYLMDLVEKTPSAYHVIDYAHKVREFAIRRKMVSSATTIAQCGFQLDKSVDELLVNIRKQIDGIESYGLRGDLVIPDSTDIALEFAGALDDIGKGVIKTYIPKLDQAIGGLDLGTITVLASASSMGKSTLAFQISRNIASRGSNVLYFSNEMTRMQLWIKATCGAAKLSWREVKRSGVSEQQKEILIEASSKLIDQFQSRLRIDDRSDHTTQTVWQACRKYHPQFAVVDVLQNLNDKGEKEVDRLGEIIKQLKFIAKDTNCHMLALTHVNRSVEYNKNKIPTMSELRDSGKLENTADNVLLITSDDYYSLAESPKDYWKTKLIIAKCRDGMRNIQVNLWYDLMAQWFEDDDPQAKDYVLYKD